MPDPFVRPAPRKENASAAMTVAALGVVFGDIGTSPLYAMREAFSTIPPNHDNVLGILSLVFWAITIVVSLKYVVLVMRADNRGEGGNLALTALVQPSEAEAGRRRHLSLLFLGLFGASLLYGDGIITPAISVLSAVEGLKVATPVFEPLVLPLTLGLLIALFLGQKHGTAKIGSLFGPVIILWFTSIGILGALSIAQTPHVLLAVNPWHAVAFFIHFRWHAFLTLGAVFLALTGAEALYADMGHFGRKPIRQAWFFVAMPGLLCNYFGQGALLLREPQAQENPFFHLAPDWALYPLVALSALATIIASQAIISGTFSITSQAMKLGLLPRMTIHHTSKDEMGQIYVSQINWGLLIATIWLVLTFRSSSALAAAYGVAVSTTMVITTILIYFVTQRVWGWSRPLGLFVMTGFLLVDLAFFFSNATKIHAGGWFPLLVGIGICILMSTWRRGRQLLVERLKKTSTPLSLFVQNVPDTAPVCVPGVAVYMNADPEITPPALVYNLRHNKVVHELNVIVMVVVEEIPYVSPVRRVRVEELSKRFYRVTVSYGFMDPQDVPRSLSLCKSAGLDFDVNRATFFLGRETLLPAPRPAMSKWRSALFDFMSRNALRASHFFRIKASQVIEIGYEIEL